MIAVDIHKKLSSASGEMQLQAQFEIERGSFVTLYGKSGAGKTSIVRILAGLFTPDKGKIVAHGTTWLDTSQRINLKPQKRKVGFLFQDYALFPNMTVKGNLLFALRKGQDQKIVAELIEIFELGGLQNQKPATLSGGQKQRVALARALVQRPEILLLDEPLSALDTTMRLKLQNYILHVHREYSLTTILISHDISEILKMSDKIIEVGQGKIVRQGSPEAFFSDMTLEDKLQLSGEIAAIDQRHSSIVITILIGRDHHQFNVTEKEARQLKIGDKVRITSLALHSSIQKIS